MSEETDPAGAGPHDQFLTQRLAALRREHPEWPVPMYRMHLIKAMREEIGLRPKEAMATVDAYYDQCGLSIRQPTVGGSIIFALVTAVVLLVPLTLVFLLLRYLRWL